MKAEGDLRLLQVRADDTEKLEGLVYYEDGFARGRVKLQVVRNGEWVDVPVVSEDGRP